MGSEMCIRDRLKDFYRERGVLYPVEDMGPVEATSKAILAILRQDG